jgi:hypothetical protein
VEEQIIHETEELLIVTNWALLSILNSLYNASSPQGRLESWVGSPLDWRIVNHVQSYDLQSFERPTSAVLQHESTAIGRGEEDSSAHNMCMFWA